MSSILTNQGAMVALQTMKTINKNMGTVQNQISTGLKVGTAKDNSAIWAIGKTMSSDAQAMKTVQSSIALGQSTVAVARSATESVVELLGEMKSLMLQAGENVDNDKIADNLTEMQTQIQTILDSASFNGLNLLNQAGEDLQTISALKRDSAGALTLEQISVVGEDMGTGIANLNFTLADPATITTELGEIETQLQAFIDKAAQLGVTEKRMEIQSSFVGNLIDGLRTGVGAMVDADMEEASARLQALQVQQQLGIQALSIANQQPQNILSLFR